MKIVLKRRTAAGISPAAVPDLLYDSKNKPPALQGEGSSLDQRNSCAKINVGLQTTNKKHRRSKEWTQIV